MNHSAKVFYEALGKEISQTREKAKITVEDLAFRLKLSPKYVNEVEAGLRKLSCFALNEILKIIDAEESAQNN